METGGKFTSDWCRNVQDFRLWNENGLRPLKRPLSIVWLMGNMGFCWWVSVYSSNRISGFQNGAEYSGDRWKLPKLSIHINRPAICNSNTLFSLSLFRSLLFRVGKYRNVHTFASNKFEKFIRFISCLRGCGKDSTQAEQLMFFPFDGEKEKNDEKYVYDYSKWRIGSVSSGRTNVIYKQRRLHQYHYY